MDIHKKHKAYTRLKTANKEAIERDIALLKANNPQSAALSVSDTDLARKGQEVLWELLDVATIEEIESARDLSDEAKSRACNPCENLNTDNKEGEDDSSSVAPGEANKSKTASPAPKKKARKKSIPTSSGKKTTEPKSKKQ